MTYKERSDGRYEGRLTINGKRKSFYGDKKSDIKRKAKEYLQKVENGYKEPQKIRLNDYIEYWLKTYKWNKIEPTSYTRIYKVYQCQIHDSIGQMMIGDLKTSDIQKLIDDHANPPDNDTTPLALSGLKKIIHLLRPCLNMAIEEGIISKNPCDNVILPVESCIQKETKEQYSLSDDEIEEFKNAALAKYKTTGEYRSRDAIVLLLILNLGLRAGEMLALQWKDVNIPNRTLLINKTVQSNIKNFTNKEGNAFYSRIKQSAKTKNGVRVLPLNDEIIVYFNLLKEYDKRHGIKSPLVACTTASTQNNERNLQRSLKRLIKNTGINPSISLHTLRHTFGSTLVRRGIGIEIVSKLMGHANITITYNKYIHVLQEEKVKTMQNIRIC